MHDGALKCYLSYRDGVAVVPFCHGAEHRRCGRR